MTNFTFLQQADARPLFNNIDCMISDVSGMALDFLVCTHRPVLFMDVPEKTKNAGMGFSTGGLEQELKAESPVCSSSDDVIKWLDLFRQTPDIDIEKRIHFSDKVIFNPGCATQAAADQILKLTS